MNMLRRGFLPPVGSLIAFECAARHESVSGAAHELHLTQSAVSRQIQRLEELIGVPLFKRVRKRIIITDAGRVYMNDVQAALAELADATHNVMAFGGKGDTLNLAVLPSFATRWLLPRLPEFLSKHANVTIHMSTRVESFDFKLQPFDAAIHFGSPDWPGAICNYLMGREIGPVVSPQYRRRLRISSVEDLQRAVLIHQRTDPFAWSEWFEKVGAGVSSPLKGPRYDQFAMSAQAAIAGLGVALVPKFLVEEELESGRLELLFPQWLKSTDAYYFVYPEAKAGAELVQSFKDWIVQRTLHC